MHCSIVDLAQFRSEFRFQEVWSLKKLSDGEPPDPSEFFTIPSVCHDHKRSLPGCHFFKEIGGLLALSWVDFPFGGFPVMLRESTLDEIRV